MFFNFIKTFMIGITALSFSVVGFALNPQPDPPSKTVMQKPMLNPQPEPPSELKQDKMVKPQMLKPSLKKASSKMDTHQDIKKSMMPQKEKDMNVPTDAY